MKYWGGCLDIHIRLRLKALGAFELQRKQEKKHIKVARIVLLPNQSSASELPDQAFGNSRLVVIPCTKRVSESTSDPNETVKTQFKKKMLKRKHYWENVDHFHDKRTGVSVMTRP